MWRAIWKRKCDNSTVISYRNEKLKSVPVRKDSASSNSAREHKYCTIKRCYPLFKLKTSREREKKTKSVYFRSVLSLLRIKRK